MLKSLLCVCSIFLLLVPTIFLPSRVEACPVKLPETLLSLYRSSDDIYIARFAKQEDLEITEDNENYTAITIKKHFDISSTLKGEPRKLFVLHETDYGYKSIDDENEEGSEVEEIQEEEIDVDSGPTLKAGDQLLLFLRTDEETGNSVLTDYRDGVKKMTAEALPSYEARIRELNSIFSAKKVDDTAIVEWLVRCAEDPVTRWESAFEFHQSFSEMEWRDEQAKDGEEEGEETASTESSEPTESTVGETQEEMTTEDEGDIGVIDRSVYARLLTDAQKQTLLNIVLEPRENAEGDKPEELSSGDKILMSVVANWGDNRFARALLERLGASTDDPYYANDLMTMVSKVIRDDHLANISSRYSGVYYQDDDAVVEADDDREAPELEGENKVEAETPAAAEVAGADAASVTETQPAKKMTYKDLRAELVAKFIDRGIQVLQSAESEHQEEVA